MNSLTEREWLAWLEATGYGPDHYSFDRACRIMSGEIGDTITRDSIKLFTAGYSAGYRESAEVSAAHLVEVEKMLSQEQDHRRRESERLDWLLPKQYSHRTRVSVDNELIAESMKQAPTF